MRVGEPRIEPRRAAVVAQGVVDAAIGGLEVAASENRVRRRDAEIGEFEGGLRLAVTSESVVERGEVPRIDGSRGVSAKARRYALRAPGMSPRRLRRTPRFPSAAENSGASFNTAANSASART